MADLGREIIKQGGAVQDAAAALSALAALMRDPGPGEKPSIEGIGVILGLLCGSLEESSSSIIDIGIKH